MQNRRNFLKQASLLLAGGLVAPQILSSCGGKSASNGAVAEAAGEAAKKHIGLQLYSLRDDINDLGIQKVLEIVSKLGYVNLETAGVLQTNADGALALSEPLTRADAADLLCGALDVLESREDQGWSLW